MQLLWRQQGLTKVKIDFAAASDDLRQQLLAAIAAKKGVQEAIDRIAEINPTPKPNKSDKVDGKWKLLWSSDVAEVSKVTR